MTDLLTFIQWWHCGQRWLNIKIDAMIVPITVIIPMSHFLFDVFTESSDRLDTSRRFFVRGGWDSKLRIRSATALTAAITASLCRPARMSGTTTFLSSSTEVTLLKREL